MQSKYSRRRRACFSLLFLSSRRRVRGKRRRRRALLPRGETGSTHQKDTCRLPGTVHSRTEIVRKPNSFILFRINHREKGGRRNDSQFMDRSHSKHASRPRRISRTLVRVHNPRTVLGSGFTTGARNLRFEEMLLFRHYAYSSTWDRIHGRIHLFHTRRGIRDSHRRIDHGVMHRSSMLPRGETESTHQKDTCRQPGTHTGFRMVHSRKEIGRKNNNVHSIRINGPNSFILFRIDHRKKGGWRQPLVNALWLFPERHNHKCQRNPPTCPIA